jgi:hypothetical protein
MTDAIAGMRQYQPTYMGRSPRQTEPSRSAEQQQHRHPKISNLLKSSNSSRRSPYVCVYTRMHIHSSSREGRQRNWGGFSLFIYMYDRTESIREAGARNLNLRDLGCERATFENWCEFLGRGKVRQGKGEGKDGLGLFNKKELMTVKDRCCC